MFKGLQRRIHGLTIALCIGACACVQAEPGHHFPSLTPEQVKVIAEALPEQARIKPDRPRRLLVFYRTEGFVHAAIPFANEAFKRLGEHTGAYRADFSDDMAVFTPERLAAYDAVLFNNTTRLEFADPAHRAALLAFIAAGKGMAAVHAAADNFYGWPEGEALLGGQFKSHPWNAKDTVVVKIDAPDHLLTAVFQGRGFLIRDEIYEIVGSYRRDGQQVLLSLDMRRPENARPPEKLTRTDHDFPIAWIKSAGKGRVFYCSLGHNPEIYSNRDVLQFYLDGLQYVLDDLR